jgi:hypothetical protein
MIIYSNRVLEDGHFRTTTNMAKEHTKIIILYDYINFLFI